MDKTSFKLIHEWKLFYNYYYYYIENLRDNIQQILTLRPNQCTRDREIPVLSPWGVHTVHRPSLPGPQLQSLEPHGSHGLVALPCQGSRSF